MTLYHKHTLLSYKPFGKSYNNILCNENASSLLFCHVYHPNINCQMKSLYVRWTTKYTIASRMDVIMSHYIVKWIYGYIQKHWKQEKVTQYYKSIYRKRVSIRLYMYTSARKPSNQWIIAYYVTMVCYLMQTIKVIWSYSATIVDSTPLTYIVGIPVLGRIYVYLWRGRSLMKH